MNTTYTVKHIQKGLARWRAILTRRVITLDLIEPHHRRPVLGGLPWTGRSIRTLVRGTVISLPNSD